MSDFKLKPRDEDFVTSTEDELASGKTTRTLPSDRGQSQIASLKMADTFEVRMRFTSQLQHLNASVTSYQKAAQYALKYKDMDEDLHSCILEQLEKVGQSRFLQYHL